MLGKSKITRSSRYFEEDTRFVLSRDTYLAKRSKIEEEINFLKRRIIIAKHNKQLRLIIKLEKKLEKANKEMDIFYLTYTY